MSTDRFAVEHGARGEVVTAFVLDDFPLTDAERASITAEDRARLQDIFLTGLNDWAEVARVTVEIWRGERS